MTKNTLIYVMDDLCIVHLKKIFYSSYVIENGGDLMDKI